MQKDAGANHWQSNLNDGRWYCDEFTLAEMHCGFSSHQFHAVSHFVVYRTGTSIKRADEFDLLRERWHVYLTGDGNRYVGPGNCAKISQIETNANKHWSAMNTNAGRTYLWSDLANWSVSSTISSNYVRLKEMALAYSTTGLPSKGMSAGRRHPKWPGLDVCEQI